MNQPTPMTRFIGTPRIAAVLYVGVALAVVGWAGGEIPWWLALAALCSAGTVRKAVQDVRTYNQWRTAWQAMGPANAPPRPPIAKRPLRKRKASSPWAGAVVAAVSLVVIPVCIAAPGADQTLRHALTLLWCGMALYLLWALAVKTRRALVRPAGGRQNGAAVDVVEWAIPRASSSPSRADAMRRLPEYSARLIVE